ncbi:MAG: DUF362 domain-containing protein [Myxococcales bacterium]|nr:MAG: DUF362 domain-containing protein [Myxococcales bacterium]
MEAAMKLTRREMLRGLVAATAAAPFATFPNLLLAQDKPPVPDLAVINGLDPAANVRAAVAALGGIGRFVTKGDRVTIKPNMGFGNPPEKATTTDPRVVRALAELALQAGAKRVMVIDNPCHKADIALEICGVKAAMKGLDDVFVATITAESFYREVKIPKAKSLTSAKVAIDVMDTDCLINVPVAKSHGSAIVSFGMKNWMGAVYNRTPWHVLHNLHQAIADMATFIRPRLTVLDATRALTTNGPGGPGEIASLNTIVAGVDPVAVDSFGVTLSKWDGDAYTPLKIPYIANAVAHGLGRSDVEALRIHRQTV